MFRFELNICNAHIQGWNRQQGGEPLWKLKKGKKDTLTTDERTDRQASYQPWPPDDDDDGGRDSRDGVTMMLLLMMAQIIN